MGWWITLGVLILLGLIPLGASAKYNALALNILQEPRAPLWRHALSIKD